MNFLKECASALRFLSVDAIQKAGSGHPGMPLGMADIATVLWTKFLKHNPKNPQWFNRDRFVLSNGHGAMLLYALLHLTGYALTLEDLKKFRQLHSKTPGHPEYLDTPGVETSTGPLGQGLANAVGMAIAEKTLAAHFNRDGLTLVDHFTYAFVGDGCLMEGVSHEVCSFAGTLGLGRLIVFYDDNGISIDGDVAAWFRDDTLARFKAYHWHVIGPIDGHSAVEIEQAIREAREETSKPTLIICKTIIGFGSAVAGTKKAHGSPLGADAIAQLRLDLNWRYAPFVVPDAVCEGFNHVRQGAREEDAWLLTCHGYQEQYPAEYQDFLRRINHDLPDDFYEKTASFIEHCRLQSRPMATRNASQQCIEFYAASLPELLGGSADLTGSNNTDWTGTRAIEHDAFKGNYLYYGVREFGMSAIMNGLALHGGYIPYGGTFLVFSDYARPAVRLTALMKQRVIFIYTHDSIGVGEDGPTHQPIEQLAALRMIPHLHVWRPASLMETAVAWQQALVQQGPSCLVLSRQAMPQLPHVNHAQADMSAGGYILWDVPGKEPDVILMATGSEVHLALAAVNDASMAGYALRVVSMPCVERFLEQPLDYQHHVLPLHVRKRIAIEASASSYWHRWVGLEGVVVGLESFGLSAPADEVYQALGITVDKIIMTLQGLLHVGEDV
ncbi:MAG: transketolase [Legionellaceae bacterium]